MKLLYTLLPLAALTLSQEYQAPLQDEEFVSVRPLAADAISILGFGTWRLTENTSDAVSYAIQTGYRHIDCASQYGNEEDVGKGIKDGLEKTGLSRDDLWITSKLWNEYHSHGEVVKAESAINATLKRLGLDYLNLYLMHFPVQFPTIGKNVIEYRDTWKAMEHLVDKGLTRHIGVANFSPDQMKDLLKHSSTHPPQVHQMELHPYLQQRDWVKWHQDLGIHVTAYSSLAGTNPVYDGDELPTPLLNNTVIKDIADKRDCTPAQVALMWGLSRGASVIPKSSNFTRIRENFYALECILQEDDLDEIEELHKKRFRYNNSSKDWGVQLFDGLEDSRGNHEKDS